MLRGTEYFVSLTKEGNAKARPLFEKAIELDPKYAEAYALLGTDYFVGWVLPSIPTRMACERALKMEQHAIALDDSLSFAHCVMAEIDMSNEQIDQARAEAQLAIALDPNSAAAYQTLADVLNQQVKPAEALVAVDNAMRLDPRNADNYIGTKALPTLNWDGGKNRFRLSSVPRSLS